VVFIAVGILPRFYGVFLFLGLLIYFLNAPLEETVLFFVRSIPFFIALQITPGFDSLNAWRLLVLVIFLRWLSRESLKRVFLPLNQSKTALVLIAILFLTLLSMTQAENITLSVKRLFFLVNLSLIGVVIWDLVNQRSDFGKKIIGNAIFPAVVVSLVGIVQLISVYYLNIFQFVDFWGDKIQRNLYGNAWADIAVWANTWFAYFGDRLSLRMFSSFPDSHSFPIFLLLSLPAILAVALKKISGLFFEKEANFWGIIKKRTGLIIIFAPVFLLDVVLTGTRGMWLAGGIIFLLVVFLSLFFVKFKKMAQSLIMRYFIGHFLIFLMLFGIAYPIFGSPQFQMAKEDTLVFGKRIKSLMDFSETSNARRIEIWRDSIKSISRQPLLGVGIGNFPVVVKEDLARAKAGSSAHNLYLHIAAEIGLAALILCLYFIWLLIKKCWDLFISAKDGFDLVYFGSALLFIPWVLLYSFTDVAIFDERAFLLFAITIGLILGQKKTSGEV